MPLFRVKNLFCSAEPSPKVYWYTVNYINRLWDLVALAVGWTHLTFSDVLVGSNFIWVRVRITTIPKMDGSILHSSDNSSICWFGDPWFSNAFPCHWVFWSKNIKRSGHRSPPFTCRVPSDGGPRTADGQRIGSWQVKPQWFGGSNWWVWYFTTSSSLAVHGGIIGRYIYIYVKT